MYVFCNPHIGVTDQPCMHAGVCSVLLRNAALPKCYARIMCSRIVKTILIIEIPVMVETLDPVVDGRPVPADVDVALLAVAVESLTMT